MKKPELRLSVSVQGGWPLAAIEGERWEEFVPGKDESRSS